MVQEHELLNLVDNFIIQKNGSWTHEDWLSLLSKVQEKRININEQQLGEILENERGMYNAKKLGISIIPKHDLEKFCRDFVEKTNADYSHEMWLSFLNDLSRHGYYNKNEVGLILEKE